MKTKVLLLAANPKETGVLRLGEEFREIKESIQLGKYRDNFEIVQGEAVRAKDLRRLLLREKPNIIHFSGHSTTEGICLENDKGAIQMVSGKALAGLFGLCRNLQCIILNSCYSESQTHALITVVHYVIGMKETLQDDSAIRFSVGFYDALGEGQSIADAFEYGVNAIELEKTPERSSRRSLDVEIQNTQPPTDIPIILENKHYINQEPRYGTKLIVLSILTFLAITLLTSIIQNIPRSSSLEQNTAAQESLLFQGTIIKQGTPTRLPGVKVTLFGKNGKQIEDYTTGNDGFYHISIPAEQLPIDEKCRIVAEKKGFSTETRHYTPGTHDFALTEETTDGTQ